MTLVRGLGFCFVLVACSGTEVPAVAPEIASDAAEGGKSAETSTDAVDDGSGSDHAGGDGGTLDAFGDGGEAAINTFGAYNFTLEQLSVSEQIDLLVSNGYRHVSFLWNPVVYTEFIADDRVAKGKLPVLAVLFEVDVAAPHDVSRTSAVIQAIRGHNVALWLLLVGQGIDSDLVRVGREVADLARGEAVRVVLYPHQGQLMADAEDALRIQRAIERPNVGISLHLCHEFKAGNRDRLSEVIQNVVAAVDIATINGASSTADPQSSEWADTIMPLDAGDFDVENAYLVPLWRAGYRGPLVLHTFQIAGPPEEHLRRSAERFRSMAARLR